MLDVLPLHDVALAYLESIEGIADVRVDRSTSLEIELTFSWYGEGNPVIPEEHLDRYGLIRDR
ncbi:hypothetical protein [Lysobacter capsici]|uniref:hypothetical protein n=1 Tax=Lysobacter capsici TaxID=435897 RepID=UPI00398D2630